MAVTLYRNDAATAARIGWPLVEEYVFGDPALPLVEHDDQRGIFTYVPDPWIEYDAH